MGPVGPVGPGPGPVDVSDGSRFGNDWEKKSIRKVPVGVTGSEVFGIWSLFA